MNLVGKSVILTRRYTRCGGDSENVLGLIFMPHNNRIYLYHEGNKIQMEFITSDINYANWLFDNSMDLLALLNDDYPHVDWWNDRTGKKGRIDEFRYILKSLKNM